MNVEKILINILVASIEIAIMFEICRSIKNRRKSHWWIILLVGFIYICVSVIATVFIALPFVLLILTSIILLVFAAVFGLKLRTVVLVVTTFQLLSLAYEILFVTLIAAMNNLTIDGLVNGNMEFYGIVVVMCKFALFFTMRVVLKFIKQGKFVREDILSIKNVSIHLLIPLASFVVLVIQSSLVLRTEDYFSRIALLISSLVLVVANLSAFIIYDLLEKREDEVKKSQRLIVELDKDKQYYEKNINLIIKSNKTMHDLKHKLFMINEYLADYDGKGKEIINEICSMVKSAQIVKYTGLKGLDAMLNAKFNDIMQQDINLVKQIYLTDKLFVEEVELCVIVGNLLDNATEATLEFERQKFVEINIAQKGEYLAIKIMNSTKNKSVEYGNSTKKNKTVHGFGILNVIEVIEKYDGHVEWSIKDEVCTVVAMIKNREE